MTIFILLIQDRVIPEDNLIFHLHHSLHKGFVSPVTNLSQEK